MKVFTITGLSTSGKTTTVEHLVTGLIKRGFSVGTVKEIHFVDFHLDSEGKNTQRHKDAGSSLVTARAIGETDIMYQGKQDIYKILSHYDQDYVILEGVRDAIVPEIACCKEDAKPVLSDLTIAISGRFANTNNGEYNKLPIINCISDTEKLLDLIIEKVPDLMPNVEYDCCGKCGYDCRGLLSKYLAGEETLSKCVLLNESDVQLTINGEEIVMVPFVQRLLRNAVLGVTKELKGYTKQAKIEVKLK
ncbi:MAG: molybdopterin-guanine dinucleotide biosynthesis protein MobB [Clostridia bacterium]